MSERDSDAARQLVDEMSRLARMGMSPGSSGNGSVRIGERILITPSGASLGELSPADLSLIDISGELISGPSPSKELAIHQAMYDKNPSSTAVIHLHSPRSVAVSCLPAWRPASAIPPLTPYFLIKVGQTPLVPYYPPGSSEIAQALRSLAFDAKAVLLMNHGSVIAQLTAREAADAAIELEETAGIHLALLGQSARMLSDKEIRTLGERFPINWQL